MKKYILILVLSTAQIALVFGQQFVNFDFEKKSVEGTSRPWGWALDSWGGNVFLMDTIKVENGKYSLKLHSESSVETHPSLQYNLEPYALLGKKVMLKGSKYAQMHEGNSIISYGYLTIDAENNYLDSVQVIHKATSNSKNWQGFEVSFTVPENAISVFIKIGIKGKGTIWYDNLSLKVDDSIYQELPVTAPFTNKEIEWVSTNSQSFDRSSDKDKEFHGFDFLPLVIGNSRILALGESTHGTSEFFNLKHHVFKYVVNELGFRVFALEDNQLTCEKINQFVLGQTNLNAKEAMSGLFGVWYRTEMKDLIEWIKKRNEANPDDPVYFAGYDIQNYKLPLKKLKEYLEQHDSSLLSQIEAFDSFASNIYSASDSLKQNWLNKTINLYDTMKNSSSKFNKDGLQYANLLRQYTENALKGHWSLYRDEAMAENIVWLANVKYPGKKIFVWAHDIHVAKSNHTDELHNLSNGIAMGSFLKKNLKDDYKTFGLMTYTGTYSALKTYTNFVDRVNSTLCLAPEGSLEEALHQISIKKKHQNLFLEFRNFPEWLMRPLPFRFINHVNSDYGFWQRISVPCQFDGVFFIDKTSSSHYLE